jgi:hypothetical protein
MEIKFKNTLQLPPQTKAKKSLRSTISVTAISNGKKGASGKVSSSGSSSRLELFEVPKILSLE